MTFSSLSFLYDRYFMQRIIPNGHKVATTLTGEITTNSPQSISHSLLKFFSAHNSKGTCASWSNRRRDEELFFGLRIRCSPNTHCGFKRARRKACLYPMNRYTSTRQLLTYTIRTASVSGLPTYEMEDASNLHERKEP